MKGDQKKTPTQFRKGCTPWNKGVSLSSAEPAEGPGTPESSRTVRMNKDEYFLVTNIQRWYIKSHARLWRYIGLGQTSSSHYPIYIRHLKKEQITRDTEGMKLVDNTKMIETWNTAYELHRRDAPQCDIP